MQSCHVLARLSSGRESCLLLINGVVTKDAWQAHLHKVMYKPGQHSAEVVEHDRAKIRYRKLHA